jgi:hypothetical protein
LISVIPRRVIDNLQETAGNALHQLRQLQQQLRFQQGLELDSAEIGMWLSVFMEYYEFQLQWLKDIVASAVSLPVLGSNASPHTSAEIATPPSSSVAKAYHSRFNEDGNSNNALLKNQQEWIRTKPPSGSSSVHASSSLLTLQGPLRFISSSGETNNNDESVSSLWNLATEGSPTSGLPCGIACLNSAPITLVLLATNYSHNDQLSNTTLRSDNTGNQTTSNNLGGVVHIGIVFQSISPKWNNSATPSSLISSHAFVTYYQQQQASLSIPLPLSALPSTDLVIYDSVTLTQPIVTSEMVNETRDSSSWLPAIIVDPLHANSFYVQHRYLLIPYVP